MLKTKYVTIQDEGRDKGKLFLIEEMPASRGFDWARRALSASARGGVDVGNLLGQGMAGVALLGIQGLFMSADGDVKALLDEMFRQVKIVRDPARKDLVFDVLDSDVEEITTHAFLRWEAVDLHLNFSQLGALSISPSTTPTSPSSPNTPTSIPSSERLSQRGRRR